MLLGEDKVRHQEHNPEPAKLPMLLGEDKVRYQETNFADDEEIDMDAVAEQMKGQKPEHIMAAVRNQVTEAKLLKAKVALAKEKARVEKTLRDKKARIEAQKAEARHTHNSPSPSRC